LSQIILRKFFQNIPISPQEYSTTNRTIVLGVDPSSSTKLLEILIYAKFLGIYSLKIMPYL
ncbi:hypothetical protein P6U32_33305, partial [Bacillus paranthracis]|nr:hypothetical protein [Bacillus paranthracis]